LHLKISILLLAVFVFLMLFTSIPQNLFALALKQVEQILSKNKTTKQNTPSNMIDEVLKKHPAWNRVKLENMVKRMENHG